MNEGTLNMLKHYFKQLNIIVVMEILICNLKRYSDIADG